MSRQASGASGDRDEILGDVLRLNRAEAELLKLGFGQDSFDEANEGHTGLEVAAVTAEVDPAQDNLLRSRRHKAPRLFDDKVRRQTAAAAAHKGDHAIGTAVVAAVLNLQDGARAGRRTKKRGNTPTRCLSQ